MKKKMLFFVTVSAILAACNMLIPGMGGRGYSQYDTNGERIYYTGINDQGERIDYSGGPSFGMMGSSQLDCAACHGADGSGGVHVMHMDVMDAPNIRLEALQGENQPHTDEQDDDEHDEAHSNYNLGSFRIAVILGTHPDGSPLGKDMPRWALSDQDLVDLFEFISGLD